MAVPAQILSAAQLTAMKNKLERQSRKPIESKPSAHQWALCDYDAHGWQGYPVTEWRFGRVVNFYGSPVVGPQGWYHTHGSAQIMLLRKCPVYRNDLRWIDLFPEITHKGNT